MTAMAPIRSGSALLIAVIAIMAISTADVNAQYSLELRRIYNQIVKDGNTPYVEIQRNKGIGGLNDKNFNNRDVATLNISPNVVEQFNITGKRISFIPDSLDVSGGKYVFLPLDSILALYAIENGEGIRYKDESDSQVALSRYSKFPLVSHDQD